MVCRAQVPLLCVVVSTIHNIGSCSRRTIIFPLIVKKTQVL